MASSIVVPQGYGYVAAGIMTTIPILMAQSILVGVHRKRSAIKYPQLYAEKAETDASPAAYKFNCAQRAHQNTLEIIPVWYVVTLLSGLKYPVPSAIAIAYWSFSRALYTRSYITGGPDKRNSSIFVKLSYIGFWGVLYGSLHTTWNFMSGGI
ncbi:hypothetical protein BD779DRAFT_1669359 [Infundibulicybe gibba]|nr:hypothetical protein BD779DRAFT_1669359 [Infundibulicybe gibba]